MKLSKIEIEFPVEVELTDDFQQKLDGLLREVCDKYKSENPGRTMWVFGVGSKPQFSQTDAMFLGKPVNRSAPVSGEPEFDDTVLHFEIAEREKY